MRQLPGQSGKCAGSPNGIRTRVSTLRGWCPRPLDDGAVHGRMLSKAPSLQDSACLNGRRSVFMLVLGLGRRRLPARSTPDGESRPVRARLTPGLAGAERAQALERLTLEAGRLARWIAQRLWTLSTWNPATSS